MIQNGVTSTFLINIPGIIWIAVIWRMTLKRKKKLRWCFCQRHKFASAPLPVKIFINIHSLIESSSIDVGSAF